MRAVSRLIPGAALVLAGVAVVGRPQDSWGPQEPPFRPERPIAIVGGTLVDATGAAPQARYHGGHRGGAHHAHRTKGGGADPRRRAGHRRHRNDRHAGAHQLEPAHSAEPDVSVADREPHPRSDQVALGGNLVADAAARLRVSHAGCHQHEADQRTVEANTAGEARDRARRDPRAPGFSWAARSSRARRISTTT